MRHRQKGMLKMVVLPVIYTAIFSVIYLVAGREYVTMALDSIQNKWIVGAPSLKYEENIKDEAYNPIVGQQYGELICESLDLRVPLYYGDRDSELKFGAGTWIGGALPGKEGAALIGGHDTTYFQSLEHAKEGQEIIVKTVYGEFTGRISGIEIMKASQFKLEEVPEGTAIVLYTCYPFGKVGETREERYFVYVEK